MRVAALYDIHGNLPALDAVLHEARQAQVDCIVVGGDIVPGPMPRETIARLLDLDVPVQFIYGNGELAVLAQMAARDPSEVTYWGTTSGARLPEPLLELVTWTARQIPEHHKLFRSWPRTLRLDVDGLGEVLFCHATPRDETEIVLPSTPDDVLLPILEPLRVSTVVCGHTHMQSDRAIGRMRLVNAGSIGMPFGEPGAYWLLLGPNIELRHTMYDLATAAELIRQTKYPQAQEFAANNVLQPPSEAAIREAFEKFALK
jgi:predicted phosphodiesterase